MEEDGFPFGLEDWRGGEVPVGLACRVSGFRHGLTAPSGHLPGTCCAHNLIITGFQGPQVLAKIDSWWRYVNKETEDRGNDVTQNPAKSI